MKSIEVDAIVFGYGSITSEIITTLCSAGSSIVCITDQAVPKQGPITRSRVNFVTRSELSKYKVNAKSAIFTWRDMEPLLENEGFLINWMKTNFTGIKRSLFLSSASVYKDSTSAVSEFKSNLEVDAHKNMKYILENTLAETMQKNGSVHSSLRISNAYGLNLSYGFIGSLFQSIQSQKPIKIFSNLNVIRDYVSTTDIAYAVQELLKSNLEEPVINVSTGAGLRISEVLDIFANRGFSFEDQINIDPPVGVKLNSILDCTLLKLLIAWNPRSLVQGVDEILINCRKG